MVSVLFSLLNQEEKNGTGTAIQLLLEWISLPKTFLSWVQDY